MPCIAQPFPTSILIRFGRIVRLVVIQPEVKPVYDHLLMGKYVKRLHDVVLSIADVLEFNRFTLVY